jgi:hypothetical protein
LHLLCFCLHLFSFVLTAVSLIGFSACFTTLSVAPEAPKNPCQPSPCGPFSLCRMVNGHPVCSCQANYIGTPPACRPECVVSADCTQDRACINQKCADPCPGTCGVNARCQVVNHNPICSCSVGFTGDPFVRCVKEQSKISFKSKNFCFSLTVFLYIYCDRGLCSTELIYLNSNKYIRVKISTQLDLFECFVILFSKHLNSTFYCGVVGSITQSGTFHCAIISYLISCSEATNKRSGSGRYQYLIQLI